MILGHVCVEQNSDQCQNRDTQTGATFLHLQERDEGSWCFVLDTLPFEDSSLLITRYEWLLARAIYNRRTWIVNIVCETLFGYVKQWRLSC